MFLILSGFEKLTGWQVVSNYEPLPSALKLEMKQFFRPLNEILFKLIGHNFSSLWYTIH